MKSAWEMDLRTVELKMELDYAFQDKNAAQSLAEERGQKLADADNMIAWLNSEVARLREALEYYAHVYPEPNGKEVYTARAKAALADKRE